MGHYNSKKLKVNLEGSNEYHVINDIPRKRRDHRYTSSLGDAILEKISAEMVSEIKDKVSNNSYTKVHGLIRSNVFLSQCERPFKVRRFPDSAQTQHTKADRTESWIWFLYVNYGKSAVKRYLLKELDKYYNKHF